MVTLTAPTGVVATDWAKREVADSPAAAINERRSAEPERGEWGRFIRFPLTGEVKVSSRFKTGGGS
jgi:hypothetical protein